MLNRSPQHPTAYDDDWEGQPTQSGFHQWFVGVVVPLFFAGVGVYAIAMQTITYGSQTTITLHGTNATVLGLSSLAIALFLHCHYFWGNVYDQTWFAVLGKIVSAIAFISATGFLIVRGFLFGLK